MRRRVLARVVGALRWRHVGARQATGPAATGCQGRLVLLGTGRRSLSGCRAFEDVPALPHQSKAAAQCSHSDTAGVASVTVPSAAKLWVQLPLPHIASPLFSAPILVDLCAPLLCVLPQWSGVLPFSGPSPPPNSEFDLCRGKIADILMQDYPAFFERDPEFGIYAQAVSLEVGQPSPTFCRIRGKAGYCTAIRGLRQLVRRAVRNGTVDCSMERGEPYGHERALRVVWTCRGETPILGPVLIKAISIYSLGPEECPEEGHHQLAYRVIRHQIEFLEVIPPGLLKPWLTGPSCQEPAFAV